MLPRFLVTVTVLGAAFALTAPSAPAQVAGPENSYAAKFVCGTRSSDSQVVRGTYETSINIHNPHFIGIQFRKKAVLALPQGQPPQPPTQPVSEQLPPDGALGVHCANIRALFVPPIPAATFIEGFLVIYIASNRPIDVVEVLTARHRGGVLADFSNEVETIHTRQVNPIRALIPNP